jgi:hypothetical protein
MIGGAVVVRPDKRVMAITVLAGLLSIDMIHLMLRLP